MFYVDNKMIDIEAAGCGYRWRVYARHGSYASGARTRRLLHTGWAWTQTGAKRRAMRAARWRSEWQMERDRRLRTPPSRAH